MKKVILVTNIPNPYRVPLFNEVQKIFPGNNLHLNVIFAAENYKRRFFVLNKKDFQFEYSFLDDSALSLGDAASEQAFFRYKGLSGKLRNLKPDVIIVSGFSTATIRAFIHKLLYRTPYIIYTGSIETKTRNTSFIRTIQRKLLIKFADSFIAYGSRTQQYLEKRGAPSQAIFRSMNTIDTAFFSSETFKIRDENPYNGVPVFTYVGYLVPRKNVALLLQSVKLLASKGKKFKLDILGDGISRPALEKFVTENNLDDVVTFHGFRQKEELPQFFAKSSGFLFQTDFDIWGLVLNEAMAAGVPCLASHNAGATVDLIRDGETGFVVDFNDFNMVAEKMEWLIDHREKASEMGKRASDFIVNEINLHRSANAILKAALFALNKK